MHKKIKIQGSWDYERGNFVRFWFLVALRVVPLESSFAAMTVESEKYDMEKVNAVYQR